MKSLDNAVNIINNNKHDANYNTMYLFTNENLNELTNKLSLEGKNIITVCSSGDQFFNFLLNNPKNISLFDINNLTKYIFYLKKSSIENLDYDAFKDFLLPKKFYNKYLLSRDLYNKIKEDLPDKIKNFWDELYKYYNNYELYNSNLFYSNKNATKIIIKDNNYLDDEYKYYKLRNMLKNNKEVDFFNINIFKEFIKENTTFDYIYLSNILDYLEENDEKEYYKKLKKIIINLSKNLNIEGEIGLNYIFNYLDDLWLKTNHYIKSKVKTELILGNKHKNYRLIELPSGSIYKSNRPEDKDAVLVYKKTPIYKK